MTNHVTRSIAALTAIGICLAIPAATSAATTGGKRTVRKKPAAGATTVTPDSALSRTGAPGASPISAVPRTKATPDSMTLRGGETGTKFDDLTIEGEDRIRIEFDRPPLDLAIDPQSAPGLAWNRSLEVLDRGAPSADKPLLDQSAGERDPYLARPCVSVLATGPVVRFAPKVNDVERWTLGVADSRGRTVASFGGSGSMPAEITWDGVTQAGTPALPGLVYSFVLEAHDRAGNKRNFMGDAFEVRPYVRQSGENLLVLFTGKEIAGVTASTSAVASGAAQPPAAVLLETASRLNQLHSLTTPIRIEAHARSFDQARTLADRVAGALHSLVMGDPARFAAITTVEPDAPEAGSILVKAGS